MQGLSAAEVLSSLFIGSNRPAAGSTAFTADGFKYHIVGSDIDENTIFEVKTKGKTLFLKNIRSTVQLQGWESMAPVIFEAEHATLHNAVSTITEISCLLFIKNAETDYFPFRLCRVQVLQVKEVTLIMEIITAMLNGILM